MLPAVIILSALVILVSSDAAEAPARPRVDAKKRGTKNADGLTTNDGRKFAPVYSDPL